jgi:hypothetical protein
LPVSGPHLLRPFFLSASRSHLPADAGSRRPPTHCLSVAGPEPTGPEAEVNGREDHNNDHEAENREQNHLTTQTNHGRMAGASKAHAAIDAGLPQLSLAPRTLFLPGRLIFDSG